MYKKYVEQQDLKKYPKQQELNKKFKVLFCIGYNEITVADIQDIQDWATDDFFPVLRFWGFDIPEGYYMSIVDKEVFGSAKKAVGQVFKTDSARLSPPMFPPC